MIGSATGIISPCRSGATGSNTIRMTHEQIAQHISSAREAVARMLKSFSEDGLVELRRGAIMLRDKNSLNHLNKVTLLQNGIIIPI